MKIIVGLGNPGEKYNHTRHNVGFHFVDHLLLNLMRSGYMTSGWTMDKYFNSWTAKLRQGSTDYALLVKPNTFMNNSGLAVRAILDKSDIEVETDLLLAYDDLDIPLGSYKIGRKTPHEHNGVNSIKQHIRTGNFVSLRIGVDDRAGDRRIPSRDYVLMKYDNPVKLAFDEVYTQATKEIRALFSI